MDFLQFGQLALEMMKKLILIIFIATTYLTSE